MKAHVKKGDTVIVLAGKDKGSKGKIMKVVTAKNRVIVEGVNVWKKHTKPRRSDAKGEIVNVTRSIHISNVSPVDPKGGKATRVAKKVVSGKRVRVAAKSGQEL
jgi:large subunit ribosomal protein L24